MFSLMVPTKDRSDFLERLLQYYADTNYKYCIYIGDSSNAIHLQKAKQVIKRFEGKLNITHIEYPNVCIADCLKKLIATITTPYAAILPDDDFIISGAIEKCINFLEKNPGYSAAHGKAIMFTLKSSGDYLGVHGKFDNLGDYKQRAIEGETATERLLDHLRMYTVTLFSVHRRETWQKMFKECDKSPDRAFMEEVLPCALSVIYGKVKQLDCLYLVRQAEQDRRAIHLDEYDWITSPRWYESYNIFHHALVDALIEQDKIEEKDACELVKQAFWLYINSGLNSQIQDIYGKNLSFRVRIRALLKKIRGADSLVLTAYHYIQSLMSGVDHMTLRLLLNPKSMHHNDFMPVYRIVTKG